VKKERYCLVCIESGSGLRTLKTLTLDEFIDNNKDLFVRYPLKDDEDLIEHAPRKKCL
jgi:hypothetical protein